jgi:hypothetical protein
LLQTQTYHTQIVFKSGRKRIFLVGTSAIKPTIRGQLISLGTKPGSAGMCPDFWQIRELKTIL